MPKKNSKQEPVKAKNTGLGIKFMLLFGLCLLVALWIGFTKFSQHNDKARFVSASAKRAAITQELINYLGGKVESTEEVNQCFHTEQGPYDNGHLWCQTGSLIILNSVVDYGELGNQYSEIGKKFGKTYSQDGLFMDYWVELPEHIRCHLALTGPDKKPYGNPRRAIFTNATSSEVSVTCASRAKASYYSLKD